MVWWNMAFTLREKHFIILEQTTKGLTLSPLNPVTGGKPNVFSIWVRFLPIRNHAHGFQQGDAWHDLQVVAQKALEEDLPNDGTGYNSHSLASLYTLEGCQAISLGLLFPALMTGAAELTGMMRLGQEREDSSIFTHHSRGHFLGRRATSCTFPPQFPSFMPRALDAWSWSQLCCCVGYYTWVLRVEEGSMEGCHQFSPPSPLYPFKELHPATFRSLTLEWEMTLARVPRNPIKS